MKCHYCFAELPEGSTVCKECLTPVRGVSQQQMNGQLYSQSVHGAWGQSYSQSVQGTNGQSYSQPLHRTNGQSYSGSWNGAYGRSSSQANKPVRPLYRVDSGVPMKWFYYLIYFHIFAWAIINAISGYKMVTGKYYKENPLIYMLFPSLKTADVIFGICILIAVAFGIYTRFSLARFSEKGPKLLTIFYIVTAALAGIYIFTVNNIVGDVIDLSDIIRRYVFSIAESIIMTLVNVKYFKNREQLFIY